MKTKFRVGDTVQSHFRAHWYGTVLRVDEESILVLVTHDKSGNKQRKPFKKRLHEHWLSLREDTEDSILYREALGINYNEP
jgi:hypothetical protein